MKDSFDHEIPIAEEARELGLPEHSIDVLSKATEDQIREARGCQSQMEYLDLLIRQKNETSDVPIDRPDILGKLTDVERALMGYVNVQNSRRDITGTLGNDRAMVH